MDLTVLIADSNDLSIKDCINSIDENVEVLVSLNAPSKELIGLLDGYNVRTCFLPDRGLAAALNSGVRHSTFDKIVVIDSDCTFQPGTLHLLNQALDEYEMVRGIQITLHHNLMQKIISQARKFHGNTEPNPSLEQIMAYKPLGFRKSIQMIMGGKIYNDQLKLSEDYEMDQRRKKAGIELGFIQEAKIFHQPIGVISDLRSAFRYGSDRFIMVEQRLTKPKKSFMESLEKLYQKCLPKFGFPVFLYMIAWTLSYDSGYYCKKFEARRSCSCS